jgi:uncharacterized protein (TIGR01777 family)
MTKKVLIAGANGLIGKALTQFLQSKHYEVSWLVRKQHPDFNIKQYLWDPNQCAVDKKAFVNTDVVINLAGAGIAEKRWTPSRKKEIISSRILAVKTLAEYLKNFNQIHLINASAVGFYGSSDSSFVYNESSDPGVDYMAEVCKLWEQEVFKVSLMGINTSVVRIGVVLSEKGGALPQIAAPIKLGLGSVLGKGNQYMSWIHINDLLSVLFRLAEGSLEKGIYNAVAPFPVSNAEFTGSVARALNKRILLPAVPSFVLKMLLGEMSDVVLKGNRVSAQKLIDSGFEFQFKDINSALADLLKV